MQLWISWICASHVPRKHFSGGNFLEDHNLDSVKRLEGQVEENQTEILSKLSASSLLGERCPLTLQTLQTKQIHFAPPIKISLHKLQLKFPCII